MGRQLWRSGPYSPGKVIPRTRSKPEQATLVNTGVAFFFCSAGCALQSNGPFSRMRFANATLPSTEHAVPVIQSRSLRLCRRTNQETLRRASGRPKLEGLGRDESSPRSIPRSANASNADRSVRSRQRSQLRQQVQLHERSADGPSSAATFGTLGMRTRPNRLEYILCSKRPGAYPRPNVAARSGTPGGGAVASPSPASRMPCYLRTRSITSLTPAASGATSIGALSRSPAPAVALPFFDRRAPTANCAGNGPCDMR